MEKTLFISVDGQQIYLESLFLPILSPLNNKDNKIEVLQFCLDNNTLKERLINACKKENINIYFGKYFNKPPLVGSFLFILVGAIKLFFTIKKQKPTILMPRSLVAGAMVLLVKPFFKNIQIVFETDGLMADERVDFAGWSKSGFIYKLFRKIEKNLIETSTAVTTRTIRAKNILLDRTDTSFENKIEVIPNGKSISKLDLNIKDKLKNEIRAKLNFSQEDLVFIYVGSVGNQYEPNKMLDIFKYIHTSISNAKFIILTPNINESKIILENYRDISSSIYLDSVQSNEVVKYTSASDIGFTLRTPSFSQQGICPLKLIDYLQVGIPVIANKGVGDLDDLFEKYNIGYIIDDLNKIDYNKVLEFIQTHDKYKAQELNQIAINKFSLSLTIDKYKKLFQKVIDE